MNESISVKKIFKGASIYSLSEMLVKSSGLFLIPLYTRILTPTEYGIVGYLNVFIQIAVVLIGFGFTGAQTRFYYENNKDKLVLGRFLFTINLIPLFFLFLMIIISVFAYIFNWNFVGGKIPYFPYILCAMLISLFRVYSNNSINFYKTKQKFATASFLRLIQFALVTAFSIYFVVKLSMGALGNIYGIFLGSLVFFILAFIGYSKSFVFKPSFSAFKYAIFFGAPMVVHLLASTLHNSIDRIILEKYVGFDKIGIFSLGYTVGNAFNMLIISFNQAYQPSFYQLMSSSKSFKEKEMKIISIFKIWLSILTLIAVFAIFLGGPILKYLSGEKFKEIADILPWFIISVFFGSFYYFFSSALFYYKKTKLIPLVTISSVIVNIILNILLIPYWGLKGALFSTIISHIFMSIFVLFLGNRYFKIKWPYSIILLSAIIVILPFLFKTKIFVL